MKLKRNDWTVFVGLILTFVLIGLAACSGIGEKDANVVKQQQAKKDKDIGQVPKEEAVRSPEMREVAAAPPPPGKLQRLGGETGYDMETPVDFNTEEYGRIYENEFKDVSQNPLSTFSIDVDNASYANVRRFINNNRLPHKDAVRIEEMINYFTYDYPEPKGIHPFTITTEIAACPWNKDHQLIHIGLQGKRLNYEDLRPCNLVFLVDSSGSMSSANKLPLLQKSLKLLLEKLDDRDKVAIVAYAGSAGLVLPSTPASKKENIINALEQLRAGGSTAGGAGIKLAYQVAKENLITNGNNRVILCTDGDFNVGVSSTGDLVRLIEEKRKDDIYLTICGFGMGNYKDSRMEQISNAGNGNYFYIDNIQEAKKVFVKEMRANLFTIAKDVKIQVEFNPTKVKAYRLVGYENRVLADEDFDDDKKDAGELGAGHTVTALYELIPAGSGEKVKKTGDLKYQETKIKDTAASSAEIMTVKFRYKPPKEEKSKLIEHPVIDPDISLAETSNNFRFSAAVAGFGMLLRDSKFKGNLTYDAIIELAKASKGKDPEGYRAEFIRLVETCSLLSK
ncbi:MAG: von Willebrand factor type A domain-containing protein [Candidatus Aminicenantes bacterium]|jgi:Ca-activated chloride channel family protein